MKTTTSLQAITTTLLLCGTGPIASAMEQVLYIDGKVRTEGVSIAGTRVMVERDGILVQMLTEDIGRIQMRLDLQRTYILSFERAGCMTKKLYFDTHVPKEALMNAPFTFPFKVTLKENEASDVMRYAQPVGFIRYFHAERDFGYDKNYNMKREELPDQELIATRAPQLAEPGTSGPSIMHEPPADGAARAADPINVTPISPRPAPLEVLAARPMTAVPGAVPIERANPIAAAIPPPLMRPAPKTPAAATRDHEAVANAPRSRPAITRVITIPRKEQVVLPDGRTEEVQVERTYVATTLRITKAGYTREFRRVAHKYGAVHYFFNGLSCGEATYIAGINE